MYKYPRTQHLAGSRLQPGDEDLTQVPFEAVRGRQMVVEEKLDGANVGVSFTPAGRLMVQSRGHYLTGGPGERQFALLKSWTATVAPLLWPVLGDRYVLYGEWLYAKHTSFYDALPHYLCEFDILDRRDGQFLDTPSRASLLAGTPVVSVPVLRSGEFSTLRELTALVGPSRCRTATWREHLVEAAVEAGQSESEVIAQTDMAGEMEGLYLKVEENGRVVERYKWVRSGFLQALVGSGGHWADRPIVCNRLADPGVMYGSLYASP